MDYMMPHCFSDILNERARQDAKWGPQNHTPMIWLGILAEEFGEAAKEINELHFRSAAYFEPDGLPYGRALLAGTRRELIQVAAVAVAMIEALDRNAR